MKQKPIGTLRRFVARAISDKSKSRSGGRRFHPAAARAYAQVAIRAVARGKKRGLR